MDWKNILPGLCRPCINVGFREAGGPLPAGSSKFGGRPDVPAGFQWPEYEAPAGPEGAGRPRPLAFLAQFDCASLAPLDPEGLLPPAGLLSFFYELDRQPWGFDPRDEGCARVFWFEGGELAPADFPEKLDRAFCLPELAADLSAGTDAPDFQDACPAIRYDWTANDYRHFDQARRELGLHYPENATKLLGWPDIIQNNMTLECELVSRGHYLGGRWESVPPEERDALRGPSVEEWRLLFQLDTVAHGDFELMFGDCGRVYFYIKKSDLLARRFDRAWLIQQSS